MSQYGTVVRRPWRNELQRKFTPSIDEEDKVKTFADNGELKGLVCQIYDIQSMDVENKVVFDLWCLAKCYSEENSLGEKSVVVEGKKRRILGEQVTCLVRVINVPLSVLMRFRDHRGSYTNEYDSMNEKTLESILKRKDHDGEFALTRNYSVSKEMKRELYYYRGKTEECFWRISFSSIEGKRAFCNMMNGVPMSRRYKEYDDNYMEILRDEYEEAASSRVKRERNSDETMEERENQKSVRQKFGNSGDRLFMAIPEVIDSDIPPYWELMKTKNMLPCSTINLPFKDGILLTGEESLTTKDTVTFSVCLEDFSILPDNEQIMTVPRTLSWDIEAVSKNGKSFPNMYFAEDSVILITCSICDDDSLIRTPHRVGIMYGDTSEEYLDHHEELRGMELTCCRNEKELLREFLELIQLWKCHVILGFNIFGFDYGYVNERMVKYLIEWGNLSRLKNYSCKHSRMAWTSGAYSKVVINHLVVPGALSNDMYTAVRRDARLKLRSYKLNEVSKVLLGGETKADMGYTEMFDIFLSWKKCCQPYKHLECEGVSYQHHEKSSLQDWARVIKYGVVDAILPQKIHEKTGSWKECIQSANVMMIRIEDLYMRGQRVRMKSKVYRKCDEEGIAMSYNNERRPNQGKYQGAHVEDCKPGMHKNVVTNDFSSLYPSIIAASNICYTTLIREEDWKEYTWTIITRENVELDMNKVTILGGDVEAVEKSLQLDLFEERDGKDQESAEKILKGWRRMASERKFIMENPDEKCLEEIREPRVILKLDTKEEFKGSSGIDIRKHFSINVENLKIAKDMQRGVWKLLDFMTPRKTNAIVDVVMESNCYTEISWDQSVEKRKTLRVKKRKDEIKYCEKWDLDNSDSEEGWKKLDEDIKSEEDFEDFGETIKHVSLGSFYDTKGRMREKVHSVNKIFRYRFIRQEVKLGVLPRMVKDGLKARQMAKNEKKYFLKLASKAKTEEEKEYALFNTDMREAKQMGIKVSNNSIYGGLGFRSKDKTEVDEDTIEILCDIYGEIAVDNMLHGVKNDLALPELAACITAEGRRIIHMAGHTCVDLFGAEIIYGDTDSGMYKVEGIEGLNCKKFGVAMGELVTKRLKEPHGYSFEKGGLILCLARKMYAYLRYADDGESEKFESPSEMLVRGLIICRRDNCIYQQEVYRLLLNQIMEGVSKEVVRATIDSCMQDLMTGKVEASKLSISSSVNEYYKNKEYCVAIFARRMKEKGTPLVAGERIEFVIIKREDLTGKVKLGHMMMLYSDYIESNEKMNYHYIAGHYLKNCINQLYQTAFSSNEEPVTEFLDNYDS